MYGDVVMRFVSGSYKVCPSFPTSDELQQPSLAAVQLIQCVEVWAPVWLYQIDGISLLWHLMALRQIMICCS